MPKRVGLLGAAATVAAVQSHRQRKIDGPGIQASPILAMPHTIHRKRSGMALGGLARLFCRALPLFGKLSGLLRRALLLRRPARFFRRANAPLHTLNRN